MGVTRTATGLAVTLLLAGWGAGTAQAAETMTIGMYGGSFEKAMRETIVPAFQKTHDLKFEFVSGNSTDTLARMQAQKAKQEIDVAILDDGVMFQAAQLGYCKPVEDAPVMKDVYDLAKIAGGKAIGIGVVSTGIVYNSKTFAEKGWPAPTSWNDLADPKFKKQLGMSPLSGTYGLHTLLMVGRANGAGEQNIDGAFKAFTKVQPNIQTFPGSPAQMSEAFQTGEVAIAGWGSGRAVALANTGFPMTFVYPKEGAAALMVAACPVVDSNVARESQEFIQHMLSPAMQVVWAKEQGFGPVNKTVKLDPADAAKVPYGPEQVGKLVAIDWDTVNANREAWNKRWVREVER